MATKRDKVSEELWTAIDALGKGEYLSERARKRQRESAAEYKRALESLHRIVMDASRRNHTLDRATGIAVFYEIIIFLTLFAGRMQGDDPEAVAELVRQQHERAIQFLDQSDDSLLSPVALKGFKDASNRYLPKYLDQLSRQEDVRISKPFAGLESLRELIEDEEPAA